jgi:hypothetical protein
VAIFSRPVEAVADINIFARLSGNRQLLVVALRMSSAVDTSFIIPLPVPRETETQPVRFLDISAGLGFFPGLRSGFQQKSNFRERRDADADEGAPTRRYIAAEPYEQCFVANINNFSVLEESAHFPAELSGAFSPYLDHAFAVFKLRAGHNVRVLPMALEFETRHPGKLYFPTYRFYDGNIYPSCRFDSSLFCQHAEQSGWDETRTVVDTFMHMEELEGVLSPNRLVQCYGLNGELPNQDTYQVVD